MTTPALELHDITFSYGAIKALRDVTFWVDPGEVVSLVGDNGAGKSTLVKVMAGLRRADSGTIKVNGEPVEIDTPKEASSLGIATVFQDLALCEELDVVGNLFLGHEVRSRDGALAEEPMELRARELLTSLNVTTLQNLRARVSRLSGGQRQSIAVARSLIGEPHVVILDEPTAALGVAQTAEVLALIERLKQQGIGVVLISHNMRNVLQVSDRVHVLYLGKTNGIFDAHTVSSEQLVAAITGSTNHDSDEPQRNGR